MNPSAASQLFLRRHNLYNNSFNAFVALTKSEQVAKDIDAALASKTPTPVTGMPVAVKEVMDVRDFPTTLCDSSLKKGFVGTLYTRGKSEAQEAAVVKRLRESGAIIVGKTNIPTKGLDVQCSNAVHGTTTNPWDPLRTSGGSSGGSCVAVATGMVPLALGRLVLVLCFVLRCWVILSSYFGRWLWGLYFTTFVGI